MLDFSDPQSIKYFSSFGQNFHYDGWENRRLLKIIVYLYVRVLKPIKDYCTIYNVSMACHWYFLQVDKINKTSIVYILVFCFLCN